MAAPPVNRRRHSRTGVRNTVAHAVHAENQSLWVVEDISLGGTYVRTERTLPVGSPVLLTIIRPGMKRALKLSGRVVISLPPTEAAIRGRSAGMAIAFDELYGEENELLQHLLKGIRSETNQSAEPDGESRRRKHWRIENKQLFAHIWSRNDRPLWGLNIGNLSLGGVFISCRTPFAKGTAVDLEIIFKTLAPLRLLGEVVSQVNALGKQGMSVRFNPLSATATQRLREIMAVAAPLLATQIMEAPAATEMAPEDGSSVVVTRLEMVHEDGGGSEVLGETAEQNALRAEIHRLTTEAEERLRRVAELREKLNRIARAERSG